MYVCTCVCICVRVFRVTLCGCVPLCSMFEGELCMCSVPTAGGYVLVDGAAGADCPTPAPAS